MIPTVYITFCLLQSVADYGLAVPAHSDNDIAIILEQVLPTFVATSFIFVVPPLLKRIVHEKETGVKVIK